MAATHASFLENVSADRLPVPDSARNWFENQGKRTFIPGKTYLPPSGKVVTANDLVALLDSSMDMWLTTGRYALRCKELLAARFAVASAHLTVSGSAANVRVDRLEAAITPRTRAVTIAHTLGNPFDLAAVVSLAQKHHLYLIEDCCDAWAPPLAAVPWAPSPIWEPSAFTPRTTSPRAKAVPP